MKTVGGMLYDSTVPGVIFGSFARGGIGDNEFGAAQNAAIFNPIVASISPSVLIFKTASSGSSVSSLMPGMLSLFSTAYASSDWVLVGQHPGLDNTTDAAAAACNIALRAQAATAALTYFDGYNIFGTAALTTTKFGAYSGPHLSAAADQYWSDTLFGTGIFSNAKYFNAKSRRLLPAHLWIGNAFGYESDTAITGDVTITNAGVTTLSGTIPNLYATNVNVDGGSVYVRSAPGSNTLWNMKFGSGGLIFHEQTGGNVDQFGMLNNSGVTVFRSLTNNNDPTYNSLGDATHRWGTVWANSVNLSGNITATGTTTLGSAGTATKNIRHGTSGAMVLGVVTVTDAGCTANTRYFFTTHTLGTVAVPSSYYASTRTASTSFVIMSSQATDTSMVDWVAFEP